MTNRKNIKGVMDGIPYTQVDQAIILRPSDNTRVSWSKTAPGKRASGMLRVYEFHGKPEICRERHKEMTDVSFPEKRAVELARIYA